MNCPNCGTEFEGDACPVCGYAARLCPSCGAPIEGDADRCPVCGAPLKADAEAAKRKSPVSYVLTYLPGGLFFLFSVLLFLFYLAPVANEGFFPFNVYAAAGELGSAMALIVFAAFSLVFAAGGLVLLPYPFLDLGKMAEKIVLPIRTVFRYLPFLFYFIIYSVGCSIAMLGGACAVLIIIFSLLFSALHAACLVLERYMK